MSIGHFRGIIPDGLVAAANFLNPRHKYKEASKYRKRYYVPVRHFSPNAASMRASKSESRPNSSEWLT